jgi:hypothetical protein
MGVFHSTPQKREGCKMDRKECQSGTIGDNIAGFSSRGPVTVDGSNRLKPDVSAPGVNIRSSVPATVMPVAGVAQAWRDHTSRAW